MSITESRRLRLDPKGSIKPLSSEDIEAFIKKNKISGFGGCYAEDNLARKPTKRFYLINTDNAFGGGIHWNCVCFEKDYSLFFNSFGVQPTEETEAFMRKRKKPILYSSSQIQGYKSILCGCYCLLCIYSLFHGQKFSDYVYSYNQYPCKKNEDQCKREYLKLK